MRKFFIEYKSEFVFGVVLLACMGICMGLTQKIPIVSYNDVSRIMNSAIVAIGLLGAWLMVRHANGMYVRKMWAVTLMAYALFALLLLLDVTSFVDEPKQGLITLQGWELVAGNFLLWLLFLYPVLVLRPGWMTYSRALLQGVPVFAAFFLDLLFDIDLRWLLALYPVCLFFFLISHIRKYRQWCEENYSSMDNIDVQWIVRYIIMYLCDGALFFMMCFFATVPIAFTQQCLLIIMLAYSTEQILYRTDPWAIMQAHKSIQKSEPESEEETPTESNAEYRKILEGWMEGEKPYLNPEFRLLDLRAVLPLNRTYLSQLINNEYGCNFYQFVTNYRLEEAKRLMRAHPDMKIQEISDQCGFSSPTVFSRIFVREEGVTPSEWSAQSDNT